jgi:hypothetical protein
MFDSPSLTLVIGANTPCPSTLEVTYSSVEKLSKAPSWYDCMAYKLMLSLSHVKVCTLGSET